ncbi:glycosyl hydrolase [Niastella koreensis]|uniref:Glycosyl hydrolase 38 domain protein n=2 Tax=Niastella koreensis TaxID=354356 RepID=G8TN46_NIAKG|nr:glycoside hydrolase family 38 C-terminal domain-containing protein [Niastella koreensis]AEV97731.1 glycosyl hydrolase 38 domain protein [Niastella koreensis GR20-10]OQP40450.1 glycosyl hydrolase [Niastella koreensis]
MKRSLFYIFLFIALKGTAQTAWFIDGYHGGIYGHLPAWQTKFMVEKLAQYPDWKLNLELEPVSWDSIAVQDPINYKAFQQLMTDQSVNGRIEYVNPAYGQAYMYNISGECIIRQLYYGMKKLRQHFPDIQFNTYSSEEPCFTSALPQLLKSYGFKYASLKNPNTCWGGYTRAFGGELVNWTGPDGSSILTSPRYAIEAFKPHSIWETIASGNSKEYVQQAFAYGIKHPVGMCLQDAGWSFGPWLRGGNETGANGVYAPTKYVTWKGYFQNISNGKADKDWRFTQEDVLVGLMWGAQVLQRIAQRVRHSENNIIQAEKLAAMSAAWKGTTWPENSFSAAWSTLLLSQHHDCWIVPYNGKPGDTWADKVVRWTGFTNHLTDSITQSATQQLAGKAGEYVRVFNTTAVERDELVRYGDQLFRAKVPAMGYASYKLNALPSVKGASVTKLNNGMYQVETDLYRLLIDPAKGGAITSWIAKQSGNKELVEKGKGINELRGNFYKNGGMQSSADKAAAIEVLENGPAEVKLAINGSIAGNSFTQTLTVQQAEPRVDFQLKIDWKDNPAIGEYYDEPKDTQVRKAYYDDRFKLLTLFPVNLAAQKIVKNAPFDVTQSKLTNTFYNRWDSIKNNVLLNWVDVQDGNGEYGLALFSDHTTSYAHGENFPLGLTIQYSGNGIFYRNYTLDGPTEIHYALLPHKGTWEAAGLWAEANKWNEPLIATAAADEGQRSLLQTDRGVEVSSITHDGHAMLVRLFNATAKSPVIKVFVGFIAKSAVQVELDGRQIKTLPIHTDKTGRSWVELPIPQFGIRTIKFEHV